MQEKIEKKYKFDPGTDLNLMSKGEFFWILKKSGLTYSQLGENAREIFGRIKPLSKQAIYNWYFQGEFMKGSQIWLLYQSLNSDVFFKYRRMYYDDYVKKNNESPYKNYE